MLGLPAEMVSATGGEAASRYIAIEPADPGPGGSLRVQNKSRAGFDVAERELTHPDTRRDLVEAGAGGDFRDVTGTWSELVSETVDQDAEGVAGC